MTGNGEDAVPRKHTHFGVYAVIENAGKVLLVRKGRGPYRGAWDLPGGKIEWGETPEEALRREVDEETGLAVHRAVLQAALSHTTSWTKPNGETEALHHLGLMYTVVLHNPDTPPKSLPDGEDSEGAAWHDKVTLAMLTLTPFALDRLQNSR